MKTAGLLLNKVPAGKNFGFGIEELLVSSLDLKVMNFFGSSIRRLSTTWGSYDPTVVADVWYGLGWREADLDYQGFFSIEL